MTPPPTHTELPVRPRSTPWRTVYDRIAPGLALLILVIALGAGIGTYFNDRAIAHSNTSRIADNEANAVTSCENANESRAASRTLWYFVVDLASKKAAPPEAAYLGEVRSWIGDVYRPHDCSDLSRKYVIPPPPAIPGAS
jgi:hypothetical protein